MSAILAVNGGLQGDVSNLSPMNKRAILVVPASFIRMHVHSVPVAEASTAESTLAPVS